MRKLIYGVLVMLFVPLAGVCDPTGSYHDCRPSEDIIEGRVVHKTVCQNEDGEWIELQAGQVRKPARPAPAQRPVVVIKPPSAIAQAPSWDIEHPPSGMGFKYRHGMPKNEAYEAMTRDAVLCSATLVFLSGQDKANKDHVNYTKLALDTLSLIDVTISNHQISRRRADAINKAVNATAFDAMFADPSLAYKRRPYCIALAPKI